MNLNFCSKIILILLIVLPSMKALAVTTNITGTIYELNSNFKKPLFKYSSVTDETNGTSTMNATHTDMNNVAILKETCVRNEDKLISYKVDQLQIGKKGSIEILNNEVIYTLEEGGRTKVQKNSIGSKPFLVGPVLGTYIKKNWTAINSGKSMDVEMGVWDRQESFGFTIKKIGQTTLPEGTKVVTLQFKLTNVFLGALVDPLTFYFTEDGNFFKAMKGRINPKIKKGSSWVDTDGEAIYE